MVPPSGSNRGTLKEMAVDDLRSREWAEARSTIDAADIRISNIRKYGFSIVTGLLTVQGLFEVPTGPSTQFIPASIKLAIIGATFFLLGVLVILDRIASADRKGAVVRARVLERQLGLELTEDISEFRNDFNHIYKWIGGIYLGFVGATGLLGYAILTPGLSPLTPATWIDLIATIGTLLAVAWVTPKAAYWTVDWSLSRYWCTTGDTVELWMTNFTALPLEAGPDSLLWKLESTTKPDGPTRSGKLRVYGREHVRVEPKESWVWVIETGSDSKDDGALPLHPGAYRLRVFQRTFERRNLSKLLTGYFATRLWDPRQLKDSKDPLNRLCPIIVENSERQDWVRFSFKGPKERVVNKVEEPWEELSRPLIIRPIK